MKRHAKRISLLLSVLMLLSLCACGSTETATASDSAVTAGAARHTACTAAAGAAFGIPSVQEGLGAVGIGLGCDLAVGEGIAEIEAGDTYGNNIVELYNPIE